MKKRYKTLVELDDQISEQLKTKEGRQSYWRRLIKESQNYDLIDLLLSSIVLEGDIIEFGVWRGHMTKRMAAVVKNAGIKKTGACEKELIPPIKNKDSFSYRDSLFLINSTIFLPHF